MANLTCAAALWRAKRALIEASDSAPEASQFFKARCDDVHHELNILLGELERDDEE